MARIAVDFKDVCGSVKIMHAVNNGPVYKFAEDQRITNIDAFRDAGIPFARNHDASFYWAYGAEHTVDVNNIFPDFTKDENDPASYDFALTDEYIKVCEFAGVRTYYRLGTRIEHEPKKYGTLPPPDFNKWARICEHIIRHYTEGWADGFRYDITYWEIWNEPDLDADDSTNKRCWGGTAKQFYELFTITFKHLKAAFPHLKIGGPACAFADTVWLDGFFNTLRNNGIKPDFYSWHIYSNTVEELVERVRFVREILDSYGFSDVESILNEWNYVKGWTGDEWVYTLKSEKNIKGASFIAAVMEACQYENVDMLMYYDARPCAMNGLFDTDIPSEKLKGYYPFLMFNTLYKLGTAVRLNIDSKNLYACAAVSENEAAVMLTHYSDDECADATVEIDLSGFGASEGTQVEYYIHDEAHDLVPIGRAVYYGERFVSILNMPNLTSYLIKIKKI